MRILVHMLPEHGHVNTSFPLAQALAAAGHEVVYTSVLDLEPSIEARKFKCFTIHRDIFPRGSLAVIERIRNDAEREMTFGDIVERLADDYLSGRMSALVREIAPALVIADSITLSPMQYVAHRLGIPCLQITTLLTQRHDELPPLNSHLFPDAYPLELETARWQTTCLRHTTNGTPIPMLVSAATDLFNACFGYPTEHTSFKTSFCPALTLQPELVAGASVLDIPRRADPAPKFLGLPVDLDRPEKVPQALADFVAKEGSLVYASLGSKAGRYVNAHRLFRAIIDAVRARPDWRAVIAHGDCDEVTAEQIPPNVLLVKYAPQMWCLRHAAVFVTHAGLGGIREAVANGVPCIAVPQRYDQPGNAMRVVYHGIGLRLLPHAVTTESISEAISTLLTNSGEYKSRLKALDAACRKEEAENRIVAVVDAALKEHSAASRAKAAPVESSSPVIPRPAGREKARGWVFTRADGEIRTGAVLRTEAKAIGVGADGFTMSSSLSEALARGAGSTLARVELSDDLVEDGPYLVGRTMRCLWTLDVEEELFSFSEWCADKALAPEHERYPELVALFKAGIRRHRARRAEGATTEQLGAIGGELFVLATPHWYRGYGAAAGAARPFAHDAARSTRFTAIRTTVRRLVGAEAGSAKGADLFAQHLLRVTQEVDAELERRLSAKMSAANLSRD